MRLSLLHKFAPEKHRKGLFRCSCGNEAIKILSNVREDHTTSCGCVRKETMSRIGFRNERHGYTGTRTYVSWQGMRNRCENPSNADYENYGGRGIEVCDRWTVFENFVADMGDRPARKSLDRIDNNGNYEPANCRWATASEQRRNQRKRSELIH